MNLHEYLLEKGKQVEGALQGLLPPADLEPKVLHEAMRYSVFAGGKRVRPILVVAGAETLGCPGQDVLDAACSLEFIHTYSLIHDDLPAMDDDDYRRGKPTNHKVYGEAVAILAGDALLTMAFEVLSRCPLPTGCPEDRRSQVIAEVAQAVGSQGMVGGQTVDILSEGKTINRETLQFIHRKKTGALLRASIRTGALLAGAQGKELEALTTFAEEFGLVFQITDDILNVVGDEEKLGKPVGTDEARAKATYPALFGLEAARQMAREGEARALNSLALFGRSADPLRKLISFLLEREH